MALKSEKLPNKPLNGEEVLLIAVKDFEAMLRNDWAFSRQCAYDRVAYSFEARFHFGKPFATQVPHVVRSRTRSKEDGVIEGEFPLEPSPEEDSFAGLERDGVYDNPNLARVHHDLPITTQKREDRKPLNITQNIPGEPPPPLLDPFPAVVTQEFRYDKTQFPSPPPPVDRNVFEKAREMARNKK